MTTHVKDTPLPNTSGTATFSASVTSTGGNTLVLGFTAWMLGNNPVNISTITDSAGNTWHFSTSTSQNPPANGSFDSSESQYGFTCIAWCIGAAAITSITVTMSASVSSFGEGGVSEFSALPAGSVVLGAASSGTLASGATSYTTPTVSASSGSPVLVVAYTSNFGGWTGVTSGYTILSVSDPIAAYNTAATAGSISVTLTQSPGMDVPSSAIVVIGAAGAHTATASLTVTPTFGATPAHVHGRTASLTVTPSFSASRTQAHVRAASLTVTPVFSAGAAHGHAAAAALTVTPTFGGTASGGALPPAFPLSSLGLTAEMQVNGTWTDLTPWMDHGPVVIGRGHPDESTTVSPSTLEMTLTNSSGEFTSQNPVGPWYPWLKPNIPLRVSIPAATSYLRLEADDQDRAFVNETSALDITGSLEARIELRPSDWGGGILACKWDGGGCWFWRLNGDGTMTFGWFDSSAVFHTAASTVPLPMLNAQTALRVTLNASNGNVTFYTAPSIDGTYAQLGAVAAGAGATSVQTATSALEVGYSFNIVPQQLLGAVTGFRLYNGIGGTVVADAGFSGLAAGATTWTDGPGRTWAIAGGAEISGRNYRGHFEVPEFPQEEPTYQPDDEDTDEDPEPDVLCAIAGGGLLRRLGQANTPLASPMRRAYVKLSSTAQAGAPAAYWPMEDLANATQLASGLGGPAMGVSGPAQLASSTAFACSLALPAVNGATFSGTVPTIPAWTDNVIRFLMAIPAAGEPNGTVIASVAGTGIVSVLQLVYTTASGGSLTLSGYSPVSQLFTTGAQAFAVNGKLLRVSMNMRQISGDLLYEIETLQVGAGSSNFFQATYTGGAVDAVRSVTLNPGGGLTTTVLGHCSVQPAWDTLFDTSGALDAWLAEPAGTRFARLCGEEGIPFRGRGNLAATIAMGAQTAETLSQLLQECADADRGVWTETRQALGWGYITRQALYNQPAAVTLDHDQDHLSPWTSDPTQDDQALLNDATITATSGSSARAFAAPGQPVTGGRLSNLPPPAGIGVYDSVPTSSVNTASDGDLQRIASWMIWIGTVDQQRFPGISVDLANTAFPYFNATVAMDLGDRLVMANPPPWLGADPVSQLCQGLKETLWAFDYLVEVNGVPETPYEVAVANVARADTAGSTLDGAVTATATTLVIATTAGPAWTTNGAWLPFDIRIGGERITVTNITSGTPQTFTVVRSVNGVVKSQPNGAAVNLFNSPVAAL